MTDFVEQVGVSLTEGLASESVVDLSDFAEEPGGALPQGWYKATVIEGYATRRGKQMVTVDALSREGDSRNLKLCFSIPLPKGDARQLNESINYRATDLTPERLSVVKQAREEFKGVKGRWANSDIQRSSLAVASLGQLGKAVGTGIPLAGGNVNAAAFVGKELDIRLRVDDNGYNEVTAYAEAGRFTGSKSKSK